MSTDQGVIKTRFANIYKFPVIGPNIIARVVKGTVIQLLDEQDEFFKVAYGNQIAYVARDSVGAWERRQNGETSGQSV